MCWVPWCLKILLVSAKAVSKMQNVESIRSLEWLDVELVNGWPSLNRNPCRWNLTNSLAWLTRAGGLSGGHRQEKILTAYLFFDAIICFPWCSAEMNNSICMIDTVINYWLLPSTFQGWWFDITMDCWLLSHYSQTTRMGWSNWMVVWMDYQRLRQ